MTGYGGLTTLIIHSFVYFVLVNRIIISNMIYLFQVEMTGSSIFDYVHQSDHAEIAEQLGLSLAGRGGGAGLNSPASGSEEGSQHGTNNPDGKCYMTVQNKIKEVYLNMTRPKF